MSHLPFDGEYLKSPSKKFNETIVFVHHFGGHKRSTRRHQNLVLEAGFDCVTFNLYFNSARGQQSFRHRFKKMFFHFAKGRRNFINQWTDELAEILDTLPGRKIIFSLSSPSTAVAGNIGRDHRKDISAWVCDCGPFLDAWTCFWNYNVHLSGAQNWLMTFVFNTIGFIMFGGIFYKTRMKKWVLSFPKGFPVLSLRAQKDALVPPVSIDRFFSLSDGLDLVSHTFVEAGHLDAVKKNEHQYKEIVLTFLQKNATRLESSGGEG